MRRTLMLATTLALLAGPAFAGGTSPQTQYNTPDPAKSSMTGQPGNMNAGQGSDQGVPQHDLATVPDHRQDSPNGKRLTTKPRSPSDRPATVPDTRPDSPNGQRLNKD